MTIDAKTVRERLNYNPDTGVFIWKTGNRAGLLAGSLTAKGYRLIVLTGREKYYAHRLAWLYVHGVWPDCEETDHVNGNRDDNRIANLRMATRSQNKANSRAHRDSRTGLKGATYNKLTGRYQAQIYHGRQFHLGCFDTAAEAHAAYVSAARDIFDAFASDGKQKEEVS